MKIEKEILRHITVDSKLLDEQLCYQVDNCLTLHSPVYNTSDYSDLILLYELILRQRNRSVGATLVKAAFEIIADLVTVGSKDLIQGNNRKNELMYKFRRLLMIILLIGHITKRIRFFKIKPEKKKNVNFSYEKGGIYSKNFLNLQLPIE